MPSQSSAHAALLLLPPMQALVAPQPPAAAACNGACSPSPPAAGVGATAGIRGSSARSSQCCSLTASTKRFQSMEMARALPNVPQ